MRNSGYSYYNHLTIQFIPNFDPDNNNIDLWRLQRGIVNALFEYYVHLYCAFRLLGYYDVLFQSDTNIETVDACWDAYHDRIQSLSHYRDNCEFMFTRNSEMIKLYIRYVFEAISNVLNKEWICKAGLNSVEFIMGDKHYINIGCPTSKDGTSYNEIFNYDGNYTVKIGSTPIGPICSIYQPICNSEYVLTGVSPMHSYIDSNVLARLKEYYNIKSGIINGNQTIVSLMINTLNSIREQNSDNELKRNVINNLASFIRNHINKYDIDKSTIGTCTDLSSFRCNSTSDANLYYYVDKVHECMVDICKNSTISNKIFIRIIMVLLLDILNGVEVESSNNNRNCKLEDILFNFIITPSTYQANGRQVQFGNNADGNIEGLKTLFPNQVNV